MFMISVWDDFCFLTWCIIMLEVAMRRWPWYIVDMKAWRWSIILAAAVYSLSIVIKGPKVYQKKSTAVWNFCSWLIGMESDMVFCCCSPSPSRWKLAEAPDLYLHNFIYCTAATWVVDWITAWISRCTGVPKQVLSDKIPVWESKGEICF